MKYGIQLVPKQERTVNSTILTSYKKEKEGFEILDFYGYGFFCFAESWSTQSCTSTERLLAVTVVSIQPSYGFGITRTPCPPIP